MESKIILQGVDLASSTIKGVEGNLEHLKGKASQVGDGIRSSVAGSLAQVATEALTSGTVVGDVLNSIGVSSYDVGNAAKRAVESLGNVAAEAAAAETAVGGTAVSAEALAAAVSGAATTLAAAGFAVYGLYQAMDYGNQKITDAGIKMDWFGSAARAGTQQAVDQLKKLHTEADNAFGAITHLEPLAAGSFADLERAAREHGQVVIATLRSIHDESVVAGIGMDGLLAQEKAEKAAEREHQRYADALKNLTERLNGKDVSEAAKQWTDAIRSAGGVTKLTRDELEAAEKAFDSYIDKAQQMGTKVPADVMRAAYATRAAVDSIRQDVITANALAAAGGVAHPNYTEAKPNGVLDSGPALGYGMVGVAMNAVPAVMKSQGVSSAHTFLGDLGGTIRTELAPTVLRALEGGGSVGRSVGSMLGGSIGDQLAGGLAKKAASGAISKGLSAALGTAVPVIGSLAGSLIGGLFGKLFGGGEAKKTAQERDQVIAQQYGSADALRAIAHEAGVADSLLDQVFSTKKVKQFESAFQQVNAQIEKHKTELEEIAQLDDARAKKQDFIGATLEKYGFTFDQIGQSLQLKSVAEEASSLVSEVKALNEAGVSTSAIADRMGAAFSSVLEHAEKTGSAIPFALRPAMLELAKSGRLVDELGNALTDAQLTGVTFGDALTNAVTPMIDKLDQIIDRLDQILHPGTGQLAAAASVFSAPPDSYAGGYYAKGGVVAPRYFDDGGPVGTDTVPAWLTPGEGVLSRRGMRALGELNAGRGDASGGVHAEVKGLRADIQRANQRHEQLLQELPAMIRHARRG